MTDITLSPLQDRGANAIAKWFSECIPNEPFQKFYLAGYAGSGKTSILPYIIDRCNLNWQDVAFMAPTGKAAKVLTDKLRKMYMNDAVTTKTIHSSIYTPARARVEAIREQLKELEKALKDFQAGMKGNIGDQVAYDNRCQAMFNDIEEKKDEFDTALRESRRKGPSFVLNMDSSVKDAKLIVCDEASMVGELLTDDMMAFNIPILAIGDPAQLPPVGDNPGLTIGRPDFFLDEIHRQAKNNPIIQLSMDIRNGKLLKPGMMGDNVRIVKRRDDQWTLNPDYDAQVLCGTHKKRWGLTKSIRDMCGYEGSAPMVDEPLLICQNSKKYEKLVNGSFVTCESAPEDLIKGDASFLLGITDEYGDSYSFEVYQGQFEEHIAKEQGYFSAPKFEGFDAKRTNEIVDFGWVITTHKSQGSQWDNVVVHDESGVFRTDADKWLYTACTRAAKELTIVL